MKPWAKSCHGSSTWGRQPRTSASRRGRSATWRPTERFDVSTCHQGQGETCGSSCSTARTLIILLKHGKLSSQPMSRCQTELAAKKGGHEWILYTDERLPTTRGSPRAKGDSNGPDLSAGP